MEPRRGPDGPLPASTPHVLIAAGGEEPEPEALAAALGAVDQAIAADGGYRLLQRLDRPCHRLVGDFDTLIPAELEAAEASGVAVFRYPAEKDQSDLEIAIDHARELRARRLTIIGALGGSWDHCLTNLIAPLSRCLELGLWGRLLTSSAQIFLTGEAVLVKAPGLRVSLQSLSPVVEGLTLRGFDFELRDGALGRSQTLGLANRASSPTSEIEFSRGELLITLMRS